MKKTVSWAFALGLLLLPAIAAAGPQPVAYYLKDGPLGLAEDGRLNSTRPNATQPSVRPVPAAVSDVVPIQFLTDGSAHPDRIVGPIYVAVYTGPALAVHANLTAHVFLLNGTQRVPIANASIVLDANASKAPQPTALVPPSPTGDPQATAYYELFQLMPLVAPPAKLLYLGYSNLKVEPTARIGVSFTITRGSSELPVPEGVLGTVQYNATLSPSFIYIPWYAPNPTPTYKPPTYTVAPRPSTSGSTPVGTDAPGRPAEDSRGVPAPDLMILVLTLAAALVVIRRRRQ